MRTRLRWALLDATGRPRVLVRVGLHAVLVLLSFLPGVGLIRLLGGSDAIRALALAIQTSLVVLATWAAARWLDRRAFQALTGRIDRGMARDVGVGLVVGAGLIGAIAIVEHGVGLATYAPRVPSPWRVLSSLLFFACVSIEEELWFRGYQLTNFAEALEARLGQRWARAAALVSSAILFGLAHALNPNASVVTTANVAVGGLLLGVSFAITGRLGVALGLHLAWNTAQCWLDMPVSGQVLYDDLFVAREERGDDGWTGGAFGPEGGLVGLSAMIVGTALLGLVAWRSGRGRELDVAAESVASEPR
jgi:membrane protease YdiL (CAAX protease family)